MSIADDASTPDDLNDLFEAERTPTSGAFAAPETTNTRDAAAFAAAAPPTGDPYAVAEPADVEPNDKPRRVRRGASAGLGDKTHTPRRYRRAARSESTLAAEPNALAAPATGDPSVIVEPADTEPAAAPRRARVDKANKANKPRTPRRSRRQEPDTSVPTDIRVVVPTFTAFDLLEGVYQKAIRARLAIMITAGAFALIAIVLVGVGLHASSQNSAANTTLTATQTASAQLESELGRLTDYTGPSGTSYNGSAMQTDIGYRAPLVRAALANSYNIAKILSDFQALAGPGITVTGVQISPAPSTTATTVPQTTVPGVPTTTPALAGLPVSISVVAASYSDLLAFINQVSKLPYLTMGTYTWAGAAPSLNGTIPAVVHNLLITPPAAAASAGTAAPTTTTTGAANG